MSFKHFKDLLDGVVPQSPDEPTKPEISEPLKTLLAKKPRKKKDEDV